jgi:putative transposase
MQESTWKAFLADHASEIVATDIFTADVWGWLGKRTVYVLFFIHLATRRVHLAGMTENPGEAFKKQTARNDTMADVGWLNQVGAKS